MIERDEILLKTAFDVEQRMLAERTIERDALAAQVAALAEALRPFAECACLEAPGGQDSCGEKDCAVCQAQRTYDDIPAAARALLDRLAKAEASVAGSTEERNARLGIGARAVLDENGPAV